MASVPAVRPRPAPMASIPAPETQAEIPATPPPAAGDVADCATWGMAAKPKANGSVGCTTPVVATTPDPGHYPLALPLHPEVAIATSAPPSPAPPGPTQRPMATTTQISRITPPQATTQPYWANQPRPTSGSQLYQFRLASLQAGELYTRADSQRYAAQWQGAGSNPTHQDWQALLQREAAVMAQAQGSNRLSVVVGDSLSLWLPAEALPRDRFWLNQSISGETTAHMLRRIHYFANTRPTTIHVMAGINDLKNGASDAEVVNNLNQMLTRLRQQHPQAQIVLYSILPTRWANLPSDRIQRLNNHLAYLARQRQVTFANLQPTFTDGQGHLHRDLTTDGLHLSPRGYGVWQATLLSY